LYFIKKVKLRHFASKFIKNECDVIE